MKFKTRLVEDIESMKKYYPDIDDNTFMEYIKLDPTYKEGSKNPGTYAKWILALATRNKGELPGTGHIKDLLTRFEESKNNLKDKNISRFKSAEELENYLEDENSYRDLSKRQQLRQTQKAVRNSDLGKDASLVYEDADWAVWVPHTYEASCKLGQGSSWCTASTASDYYYNLYTKNGDLFIIISKSNPEEKYQFHLETGSFMDKDDASIDLGLFLNKNEGLKNFFYKIYMESIFGEGVDENEEIRFNIDLARCSDNFNNVDYILLTEPFEKISEWNYEENFDLDYLPELNEQSEKILKQFTGLSEEEARQIVEEYDENNPYFDGLLLAYQSASYDASVSGAASDVQKAIYEGLNSALEPFAILRDEVYGVIRVGVTPKNFVNALWDNNYEVELGTPILEDFLIDLINNNYRRNDPYLQYADSWDENTFNEMFRENIINEFGK